MIDFRSKPGARCAMLATMVIGAALASACGDSTSSLGGSAGGRTDSEMHFMQTTDSTPPLAEKTLTFYAVSGRDTTVHIWYHARPGHTDSTEFLRFHVRAGSLVNRPDGTPIAPGDSLPITITVVDTARMIVQLEPSGLTFASLAPAHLTLNYREASLDLNGDGRVGTLDFALQPLLALWRQEAVGQPWIKLPTSVSLADSDAVEADVPGFTRYAIDY